MGCGARGHRHFLENFMHFRLHPLAAALAAAGTAGLLGAFSGAVFAQAAAPASPEPSTNAGADAARIAQAQSAPLRSTGPLPEVIVTGNPLGASSDSVVPPVSSLEGEELSRRSQGSLGETLSNLPGVSSTHFGPAASRPIIRGMDGDRIRILQNSTESLDASALSFDHAVAIDPLAIRRIEVLRGPAALLYGGSAVGGAVNLLTNRIPTEPIQGVTGSFESRVGGAEKERAASGVLEAGNGSLALHADGFWRNTSDLRIPGFARSARQRAQDGPDVTQPYGIVPNTWAAANGGSLGGSYTTATGYAGLSVTNHQINYGSPAEPNVRLDLHSNRYDFAGEVRELSGFITGLKFKGGYTDYEHREIDNGDVGTKFANRGYDTRLEAAHAAIGRMKGVFGLQLANNRFSALGDEAFIPQTRTRVGALYAYEELPLGAGGKSKLNFGARVENTRVQGQGDQGILDASTGAPRFAADSNRSFNGISASLGGYHPLSETLSATANLSHTERAPTYAELFANGPHGATGSYEVGNGSFGLEKSNSLDTGLKWKDGPHSFNVSAYYTRFSNFITTYATGFNRGSDGAYETSAGSGVTTSGGTPEFREFVYRSAQARFTGVEAESRIRLMEKPLTLFLDLKGDLVRATNLDTGEPLPRIAPARLGAALNLAHQRWSLRLEANHSMAQNRVPSGDTPTDAYTLWNLIATYRFPAGPSYVTAWLKATNLTNVEARLATSVLRDVLPLGGRALQGGVRVDF
jgi:iron complex outermembrane receptor protein